jgi:hypothetical protein
MQVLRSMLLGLAIATVGAPVALAQDARHDAPPSDIKGRAGTGAERLGAYPLMGPPRAPTVTGQSPLMVTSPDGRDFQWRRQRQDQNRNQNPDRSDLKQQGQTGK